MFKRRLKNILWRKSSLKNSFGYEQNIANWKMILGIRETFHSNTSRRKIGQSGLTFQKQAFSTNKVIIIHPKNKNWNYAERVGGDIKLLFVWLTTPPLQITNMQFTRCGMAPPHPSTLMLWSLYKQLLSWISEIDIKLFSFVN